MPLFQKTKIEVVLSLEPNEKKKKANDPTRLTALGICALVGYITSLLLWGNGLIGLAIGCIVGVGINYLIKMVREKKSGE